MDKAKSRFFADVSHEFRKLLSLIISPLEQMLTDPLDKKTKTTVRMMLGNSRRLLTMANQLQELARLESGKMKYAGETSDVFAVEAREKEVILVVEDSADVYKYIREALESRYLVEKAADGRQGIKKAKEIIPDLIVSDIMMPDVDGYTLCRDLKTDIKTSHIPFILLAAEASPACVLKGLDTGADDYIVKPFNTEILMARIRNLIHLRREIKRQLLLQPVESSVSSMDEAFLKEVKKVIEKNLGDPEFDIDELCKKLCLSQPTLYRKIRALTGQSPTLFLQHYRLKRAVQLLKGNFGNVTEVAYEVGFSSSAYFTRCFKEKFHSLPHSFLNNHKE